MTAQAAQLLAALNVDIINFRGDALQTRSPVDGAPLFSLAADSEAAIAHKAKRAAEAFRSWRNVPAPKRGELVRLFGEKLRQAKKPLGELVTLEVGKILSEGLGEVQEMIDICDYAVGLSRMAQGLMIPSERPLHMMREVWLPFGPVGVISAFNFPVAVWAWNAALAWVCGDPVVWKPSEKTPLTALACQALFEEAAREFTRTTGIEAPGGLSQVVLGARDAGVHFVHNEDLSLISATGSGRMGVEVSKMLAEDLGRRKLLELGGNNPGVVTPSANLDLALYSIFFGAVGTAGQRCTTMRRLFVHTSLYREALRRLEEGYGAIAQRMIGDPRQPGTLVGPLIDEAAFTQMEKALAQAAADGGKVYQGGRALAKEFPHAYYVRPAFVDMSGCGQTEIVLRETFAPILYVLPYDTLEGAVEAINAAPQGLSASIFTGNVSEAEYFMRDVVAGIVNVNIGTSGAEIGGAFGGEKETGGGRESGSDSWKAYMRRVNNTVYWGSEPPPLAQGVDFRLG